MLPVGGGSGIGRAVCQTFARSGAQVTVVDINNQAAQDTAHSRQGETRTDPEHKEGNYNCFTLYINLD